MKRVKAAGRAIKDRRLLFVFVLILFLGGIIAGVSAVAPDDVFDGQTAPGDHNWWDLNDLSGFCTNCHQAVGEDITAGPHVAPVLSECSFCHDPGAGEHAASVPACTDCHGFQGGELAADAHAGILDDLGETSTDAAQTCQACHTHVSVNISATVQPPIELIMGN